MQLDLELERKQHSMNGIIFCKFQDWDFPHFINNFDIKLPGLNTAHLTFHIPNFFKEKWIVHITGWCHFCYLSYSANVTMVTVSWKGVVLVLSSPLQNITCYKNRPWVTHPGMLLVFWYSGYTYLLPALNHPVVSLLPADHWTFVLLAIQMSTWWLHHGICSTVACAACDGQSTTAFHRMLWCVSTFPRQHCNLSFFSRVEMKIIHTAWRVVLSCVFCFMSNVGLLFLAAGTRKLG